ncbi:MAG: hypothetical protein WBC92_03475 [Terracidiphilus sp.]
MKKALGGQFHFFQAGRGRCDEAYPTSAPAALVRHRLALRMSTVSYLIPILISLITRRIYICTTLLINSSVGAQ